MSKFYGMVQGSRGPATRCGHRSIKTSCQSYNGSVITELSYNENNELMVEVSVGKSESTSYGSLLFRGTFNEFVEKLGG